MWASAKSACKRCRNPTLAAALLRAASLSSQGDPAAAARETGSRADVAPRIALSVARRGARSSAARPAWRRVEVAGGRSGARRLRQLRQSFMAAPPTCAETWMTAASRDERNGLCQPPGGPAIFAGVIEGHIDSAILPTRPARMRQPLSRWPAPSSARKIRPKPTSAASVTAI
jgi:hypothetical protein